jgi:hypothetical protein
MEHLNFSCGHCGQLMAIPADHLGQPVLCPHCQRPVQPPTPAPAHPGPAKESANEPVFTVAPPNEQDSIFNPAEETVTDDLFGGPAKPLLQMPEDVQPQKPDEDATLPLEDMPPSESTPRESAFEKPSAARESEELTTPGSAWPESASTRTVPAGEASAAELSAPLIRRPRASGKLVPILLMFLIPYSIVVTVWGVRLYLQLHSLGWYHRMETLPDPEKGGVEKRTAIDVPLPDKLQVALEGRLQVGDLEVIPQKIEETPQKTLVLTLFLRNISKNVVFRPLTPRLAEFKEGGPQPYTYLDMGQDRIYGGTVHVQPFTRKGTNDELVTDGKLLPGESLSATLTTPAVASARAQVKSLKKKQGELLWRVQLRRGFVHGEKGEFSATAVVGVKFEASQIRKGTS